MRPKSRLKIPASFFPDGLDPLAYGVQGQGTCMEPEVLDGSMMIASPAKRLEAGQLVVIWFFNAPPMFKRLYQPPQLPLEISRGPTSNMFEYLTFEMLNPCKQLHFRSDRIEAIHAVAGVIPPGGFKRLPLRQPRSRAPGQRGLSGGTGRRLPLPALSGAACAGAGVVAAAPPAMPAPTEHLEADLLRLTDKLMANHGVQQDWNQDRVRLTDEEAEELLATFWDLADEIEPLRATTPEGFRAKAKVLRAVYQSLTGEENRISRTMDALIRDVLEEA